MVLVVVALSALLVLAIGAVVVLSIGVKVTRGETDKYAAMVDAARADSRRLVGVLEAIRDSGPTGPDPLPPCRWCGQGSGHWGARKDARGHWVDVEQDHPECPSVVAWSALRPACLRTHEGGHSGQAGT